MTLVAETCDRASAACPADAFEPNTQVCNVIPTPGGGPIPNRP